MNRYRYEDLCVGMEECFSATVTEEMTAALHALSGDPNPLHIDEAFACAHGFPSRVVYGMLTAAPLFSRKKPKRTRDRTLELPGGR